MLCHCFQWMSRSRVGGQSMSLFLNGSTSNFQEMNLRVWSTYKSTMFSSNSRYRTIEAYEVWELTRGKSQAWEKNLPKKGFPTTVHFLLTLIDLLVNFELQLQICSAIIPLNFDKWGREHQKITPKPAALKLVYKRQTITGSVAFPTYSSTAVVQSCQFHSWQKMGGFGIWNPESGIEEPQEQKDTMYQDITRLILCLFIDIVK